MCVCVRGGVCYFWTHPVIFFSPNLLIVFPDLMSSLWPESERGGPATATSDRVKMLRNAGPADRDCVCVCVGGGDLLFFFTHPAFFSPNLLIVFPDPVNSLWPV